MSIEMRAKDERVRSVGPNLCKGMRFTFIIASTVIAAFVFLGIVQSASASSVIDNELSSTAAGVKDELLADGFVTVVQDYEEQTPATSSDTAGHTATDDVLHSTIKPGHRKPRFEEKAFTDQYVIGTEGSDGMVFATGSCALQVSEEMKTLLKQMRADLSALKSDMHAMDAAVSRTRHDVTRLQRAAATHSNILDTMGSASSLSTSGVESSPETALSETEKLKKRLNNLIEERKNLDGLCLDTRTGFCPSTLRTWTFAFRTRCCFGTFT